MLSLQSASALYPEFGWWSGTCCRDIINISQQDLTHQNMHRLSSQAGPQGCQWKHVHICFICVRGREMMQTLLMFSGVWRTSVTPTCDMHGMLCVLLYLLQNFTAPCRTIVNPAAEVHTWKPSSWTSWSQRGYANRTNTAYLQGRTRVNVLSQAATVHAWTHRRNTGETYGRKTRLRTAAARSLGHLRGLQQEAALNPKLDAVCWKTSSMLTHSKVMKLSGCHAWNTAFWLRVLWEKAGVWGNSSHSFQYDRQI